MSHDPGNRDCRARLIGLCLLLTGLLLPGFAVSQQQIPGLPGYLPGPMMNPYYPFLNGRPPLGPDNRDFGRPDPMAPAGSSPWAYPGSSTYPPEYMREQTEKPYLEIRVDSTRAYVHQNLVLTIQVISKVNLKTVAVEISDNNDALLRQLGEVSVSTRSRQGQREIVNTLYYQLTPLRSGVVELDSLRVTGTMVGSSSTGARYDVVINDPVKLTVSDPDPSVQPWLPLHELELSASLSNDERIDEGQPLTLTVEQRAVGMSGTQLPSLEAQLRAPGHRLYREDSEYDGIISKEGALVGTRSDTFTLVPLKGNQVEIPALRVNWWNVDRGRKETAVLHGRLLNELGRRPTRSSQLTGSEADGTLRAWSAWLFSVAIAFLLGRFWPRLAPVVMASGRWLGYRFYTLSRPVHRYLDLIMAYLSPRRNLHLLRRYVANNLPCSARLWFCVRSADGEQDVDDWSQVLRFLMSRRLDLPAQLPMSRLAEQIIAIHPGADADRIRALLSELEAALFGRRAIEDFDAWKAEFKRQVRPRLFAWSRPGGWKLAFVGLPALNPNAN
jgi:hypothetical protein